MHIYGIYKPFEILVSLLSFEGEVWHTCCRLQNRNGLDVTTLLIATYLNCQGQCWDVLFMLEDRKSYY